MVKRILVILMVIMISSCSKSFDGDQDLKQFRGMSEKQLYDNAVAKLDNKEYDGAIKRFEAMDTLYPFSRYSRAAHLGMIYAYYENEDFAQSAAAAQRFIHLYPRDKDVDYAYYMRGVANFEQKRGTFAKFFEMNETWRDPGSQFQSYKDFDSLVKRFPNSKYYPDSMKRMIYLRNQFAQRELNIAEFYMKRKRYVAALNRANHLLREYGQAPQAEKALKLTEVINHKLGLNQGQSDATKVLHATYPKT